MRLPNSNGDQMSDQAIPRNLHFISLNPTGLRTLLLLHGTFTSHHAFRLLLSKHHLDDYHIIIPDLPYHGLSTSVEVPFTLPAISAVIANLISNSARNGKADLIGDDIGGHIAIYMASKYPNVVSSVFTTGCERDYSSTSYSTWMSIKTYLGAILGMVLIPRSWLNSLLVRLDMDFNENLLGDMRRTISWPYTRSLFQTLHQDWGTGQGVCEKVMARTLIIAAGRQDIVEGARERGVWLRKGGDSRTKAVVVHGARHAWCLQGGKVDLMARGIRAWVENEELPVEYEILEGVD